MHHRTRIRIAALAAALSTLTACSIDTTDRVATPEPPPTTSQTPAVPDACAGASECIHLAQADVDGDGALDAITLAGDRIDVVTAAGAHTTTAAAPELLADEQWQRTGGFVGAFDINGTPGDEIVIADQLLAGTGKYQVYTWQNDDLASISTPAILYSGSPVHWQLNTGEGYRSAVRCTGEAANPIEVWVVESSYGNSAPATPRTTVHSYSYEPTAQAGEGSPFFDVASYTADTPDAATLDRFPWLCGDNTVEPAPEAVEQCGTATPDSAISAAVDQLPANPARGATWTFGGRTNFDPCADLSYALAETAGGTGSSPIHIMLFHRGDYTGTGTLCAFGRTEVVDATSDRVTVTYLYPRGMESNAAATGLAQVNYVWNGNGVTMNGALPDELVQMSGC